MPDKIYEHFLDRQAEVAAQIDASSDLVKIMPFDRRRFIIVFRCNGLVRDPGGAVSVANHFEAGINFGPDHLRRLEPATLVTWFGPDNIFHSNVRPPFVCVGNMTAGVGISEIVYQLFEIITWQRSTLYHAMNWDAAQWARQNMHRLPVDERPLRRRALNLKFQNQ
jgi:hypothetical protein